MRRLVEMILMLAGGLACLAQASSIMPTDGMEFYDLLREDYLRPAYYAGALTMLATVMILSAVFDALRAARRRARVRRTRAARNASHYRSVEPGSTDRSSSAPPAS